jgi:hypothetical protein
MERALGVDEWEREVSEERGRPSSCSGGEEGGFYSAGQQHVSSHPGNRAGVGSGLLSAAMIEIVAHGEGLGSRQGKVGLLRRKLKKLKRGLEKSMHS